LPGALALFSMAAASGLEVTSEAREFSCWRMGASRPKKTLKSYADNIRYRPEAAGNFFPKSSPRIDLSHF
jgi:hypothetical protein